MPSLTAIALPRWAAAVGATGCVNLLVDWDADQHVVDEYERTALHWAAGQGRKGATEKLLESGSNWKAKEATGGTALHLATMCNDAGTLQAILRHVTKVGELIDLPDENGLAAIHWACLNGKSKQLSAMLSGGANPRCRDLAGGTPAHLCCDVKQEGLGCLKILLKYDAKLMNESDRTGCTVLHRAVSANLKKIVQSLLKSTAVELDAVDETKRTALHWACALGHTEVTKHLLEKGADDGIQDETGATPLHYAAQQGHVGCMEALMGQKEPRCDVLDLEGRSALVWAIMSNNVASVQTILKHVDPACSDPSGVTALHTAVTLNATEIVDILSKLEVCRDVQDGGSRTPLMYAVDYTSPECVDIICRNGANTAIKDDEEKAVVHLACVSGFAEAVTLLKTHGADMVATDGRGETGLHYAAYYGFSDIVEFLITECGADVNGVDFEGITPLHWSAMQGQAEVVQTLIANHGMAGLGQGCGPKYSFACLWRVPVYCTSCAARASEQLHLCLALIVAGHPHMPERSHRRNPQRDGDVRGAGHPARLRPDR